MPWVMERIGKKGEVHGEKPESRWVFGWKIEEIVRATARFYGKTVVEIGVKRRGEPNEAWAMVMYLCWSIPEGVCRSFQIYHIEKILCALPILLSAAGRDHMDHCCLAQRPNSQSSRLGTGQLTIG